MLHSVHKWKDTLHPSEPSQWWNIDQLKMCCVSDIVLFFSHYVSWEIGYPFVIVCFSAFSSKCCHFRVFLFGCLPSQHSSHGSVSSLVIVIMTTMIISHILTSVSIVVIIINIGIIIIIIMSSSSINIIIIIIISGRGIIMMILTFCLPLQLSPSGRLPLEPYSTIVENIFCVYFTLEVGQTNSGCFGRWKIIASERRENRRRNWEKAPERYRISIKLS